MGRNSFYRVVFPFWKKFLPWRRVFRGGKTFSSCEWNLAEFRGHAKEIRHAVCLGVRVVELPENALADLLERLRLHIHRLLLHNLLNQVFHVCRRLCPQGFRGIARGEEVVWAARCEVIVGGQKKRCQLGIDGLRLDFWTMVALFLQKRQHWAQRQQIHTKVNTKVNTKASFFSLINTNRMIKSINQSINLLNVTRKKDSYPHGRTSSMYWNNSSRSSRENPSRNVPKRSVCV